MAKKTQSSAKKPLAIRLLEAKKRKTPQEEHIIFIWTETRRAKNFVVDYVKSKGISVDNILTTMRELREKIVVDLPDDIKCERGCDYCCHIMVTTSIPELIEVYNGIKDNNELLEAVESKSQEIDTRDGDVWISSQIQCPFLKDSTCSVYDIRPGSCRAYLSTDKDVCMEAFNSKDPNFPTQVSIHGAISQIVSNAMIEACQELGLYSYAVELISGIKAIKANPDALNMWTNKMDVFACAQPATAT